MPPNCRLMRLHIPMVSGTGSGRTCTSRCRAARSRVSTGEGVGELEAEPRPSESASACSRSNIGTASAHCRSSLKWDAYRRRRSHSPWNRGDGAGGLVAEDGRVALDERVQVLFPQQVGGDALDSRGGQPCRGETVTLRLTRGERRGSPSPPGTSRSDGQAFLNCAVPDASIMFCDVSLIFGP